MNVISYRGVFDAPSGAPNNAVIVEIDAINAVLCDDLDQNLLIC